MSLELFRHGHFHTQPQPLWQERLCTQSEFGTPWCTLSPHSLALCQRGGSACGTTEATPHEAPPAAAAGQQAAPRAWCARPGFAALQGPPRAGREAAGCRCAGMLRAVAAQACAAARMCTGRAERAASPTRRVARSCPSKYSPRSPSTSSDLHREACGQQLRRRLGHRGAVPPYGTLARRRRCRGGAAGKVAPSPPLLGATTFALGMSATFTPLTPATSTRLPMPHAQLSAHPAAGMQLRASPHPPGCHKRGSLFFRRMRPGPHIPGLAGLYLAPYLSSAAGRQARPHALQDGGRRGQRGRGRGRRCLLLPRKRLQQLSKHCSGTGQGGLPFYLWPAASAWSR